MTPQSMAIAGPTDVRQALARSQVTIKILAERLGIADSTLTLMLTGRRTLTVGQLQDIARVHAELAEERARMLQAEADTIRAAASDLLASARE